MIHFKKNISSIFSHLEIQDIVFGFFVCAVTLSSTQLLAWDGKEAFHAAAPENQSFQILEQKVNNMETVCLPYLQTKSPSPSK